MDIYQAAKRRGKYPSLSSTLRWLVVLVYTTQAYIHTYILYCTAPPLGLFRHT